MSTTNVTRRRSGVDPRQEEMDAAEQLARIVSGSDDEQLILVFQTLVNVLDGFVSQPAEGGADHARSVLLRTAEPMVTRGRRGLGVAGGAAKPQEISIFSDPVFIENAKKLIPSRDRIIGGIPTSHYKDCV